MQQTTRIKQNAQVTSTKRLVVVVVVSRVCRYAANQDTPNEHEEDEPNTSNKAIEGKASTTAIIPDEQYTRHMCPSGYVIADGYESFYCANISSGYTWRDCCVLDPGEIQNMYTTLMYIQPLLLTTLS